VEAAEGDIMVEEAAASIKADAGDEAQAAAREYNIPRRSSCISYSISRSTGRRRSIISSQDRIRRRLGHCLSINTLSTNSSSISCIPTTGMTTVTMTRHPFHMLTAHAAAQCMPTAFAAT